MSVPEDPVSGFFLTTTPIGYHGDHGHATGFFFNHQGTTYLITNRHAIDFKTHNDENLETVRIHIRPSPSDLTTTEHHDLNLWTDGARNWLSHPDNAQIDIAAIPMKPPVISEPIHIPSHNPMTGDGPLLDHEYDAGNLAFTFDDLPSRQKVLDSEIVTSVRGGSQAMILGYPLAVLESYFPVARSGLISSPYGKSTRDQPYFMMDARTNEGLSGSPVVTTISTSTGDVRISESGADVAAAAELMSNVDWYLIGIHAQSTDITEPLGLNGVFYPHLLREILEADDKR